jgi:nucleoside-diphosphate-sugar epimerase
MNLKLYCAELKTAAKTAKYHGELKNKTVLITGASGLVGKMFADLLLHIGGISVVCAGRSREKLEKIFSGHMKNKNFAACEIKSDGLPNFSGAVDYIVHCAAATRSNDFKSNPFGVLLSNIDGVKSIIEYANEKKVKRVLFLSTVEIYGSPKANQTEFFENDCGYLDLGNPRMAYPESKRVGELLFSIQNQESELDYIVARLPRTFGISTDDTDRRIGPEFIKKAASGENIILSSTGSQVFSFCYNADMCAALLFLILNGKPGEAYNISSKDAVKSVFQFAEICAKAGNVSVAINESITDLSHTKWAHGILNTDKITALGFKPAYSLTEGVNSAIKILKS